MRAYTSEQRKSLHKTFVAAQPHLNADRWDRNKKYEFICWAIDEAFDSGKIASCDRMLARELISRRIGYETTLCDWLEDSGLVKTRELMEDRIDNDGRKLQKTRKAWLKSLVKEFA